MRRFSSSSRRSRSCRRRVAASGRALIGAERPRGKRATVLGAIAVAPSVFNVLAYIAKRRRTHVFVTHATFAQHHKEHVIANVYNKLMITARGEHAAYSLPSNRALMLLSTYLCYSYTYFHQYLSVCSLACLKTRSNFTKLSVNVTCCRGSILF